MGLHVQLHWVRVSDIDKAASLEGQIKTLQGNMRNAALRELRGMSRCVISDYVSEECQLSEFVHSANQKIREQIDLRLPSWCPMFVVEGDYMFDESKVDDADEDADGGDPVADEPSQDDLPGSLQPIAEKIEPGEVAGEVKGEIPPGSDAKAGE